MNIKAYNRIRLLIAAALAAMVSFSVVRGNYILPLVAVAAALAVVLAMRRRVEGVINDERDYHIAGNAARWTISIYTILAATASIIFMAEKEANASFEILGSVLAYSACFLMLLNSALFYIFAGKNHGEK